MPPAARWPLQPDRSSAPGHRSGCSPRGSASATAMVAPLTGWLLRHPRCPHWSGGPARGRHPARGDQPGDHRPHPDTQPSLRSVRGQPSVLHGAGRRGPAAQPPELPIRSSTRAAGVHGSRDPTCCSRSSPHVHLLVCSTALEILTQELPNLLYLVAGQCGVSGHRNRVSQDIGIGVSASFSWCRRLVWSLPPSSSKDAPSRRSPATTASPRAGFPGSSRATPSKAKPPSNRARGAPTPAPPGYPRPPST